MRTVPKRFRGDPGELKPESMLVRNGPQQQGDESPIAEHSSHSLDSLHISHETPLEDEEEEEESKTVSTVDDDTEKEPMMIRDSTKVRFNDCHVVIHYTESHNVITEVLWFTREEYTIMKMRDRLLVQLVEQGIFAESEEHTVFGLESKINQSSDNAKYSYEAVFAEQERQRQNEKPDPELLAVAYNMSCFNAWRDARSRANENAIQALATTIEPSKQQQQHQQRPQSMSLRSSHSSVGTNVSISTTDSSNLDCIRTLPPKKDSEKTFYSPIKTLKQFLSPRKKISKRDKTLSELAIATHFVNLIECKQSDEVHAQSKAQ